MAPTWEFSQNRGVTARISGVSGVYLVLFCHSPWMNRKNVGLYGLCGENRTPTISGGNPAIFPPQFVDLTVNLRKYDGLVNDFSGGFHRNPMKPY
jgi:hypothetical protein